MSSRKQALTSFYEGPVWRAHRERANATMIDSDNVLLLRPLEPAGGPVSSDAPRPPIGTRHRSATLVAATLYHLHAADDFRDLFERRLRPALQAAGAAPLATFETETAANTFPRLPVREGEHGFVWLAAFPDRSAYEAILKRLAQRQAWTELQAQVRALSKSPPQELRLEPAARSQLR